MAAKGGGFRGRVTSWREECSYEELTKHGPQNSSLATPRHSCPTQGRLVDNVGVSDSHTQSFHHDRNLRTDMAATGNSKSFSGSLKRTFTVF